MTNLMITTACNFKCDYCFGLDMIGPDHPKNHMDLDTLFKLLDWIERSDTPVDEIHLMGGEPTLHPQLSDIVGEIRRRRHPLAIFSNASVPLAEPMLKTFNELNVHWVVNTNAPENYTEGQLKTLRRNLSILGKQAFLTVNIYKDNTPYAYVFDYINAHQLDRKIKVGVALPTLNKTNVYVDIHHSTRISQRIIDLKQQADREQVAIEFECGVPYCIFSEEQHSMLAGVHVSHCGSRLDITPDGEVINCLPLCKIARVPYTTFSHYGEAVQWFRKVTVPYLSLGKDNDCLACRDRLAGKCSACLAYGLDNYSRMVLPPFPEHCPEAG